MLKYEYHFAPRIAEAILSEASDCLHSDSSLRPGQIRVFVSSRSCGRGRQVRELDLLEVTLTLDKDLEDAEILSVHGHRALRYIRIQRLLSEALSQGGVMTQEDLCKVLHVSLRTIKRDFAILKSQGIYLPTRGNLHGIGRGQTHKAQIIKRWLHGETYDQISFRTYHTLSSIKRYIQQFLRIVIFYQQDFSEYQIAQLLQIGHPLVQEYLHVYEQNDAKECRERLNEHIRRVNQADFPQKKGKI